VVKALSLAGVKLWHDQDGDSYATVRRPNPGDKEHSHIENHKVETRIFKNIVRLIYRDAISQKAMADVIGSLNAHALDGECRKPAIRSMRHAGGLVVDLGTDDWRMVEITADGWRVVPSMDLPFIRPNGMRPMAIPVAGSVIEALYGLHTLINVQSDQDFMVSVAWMIAALYPDGPFPILAVDGEAGVAKTTACTFLRDLVDPNEASLRGVPKNEEDIILAASNSRVLAYDNLSNISPDMADALCRVATGAGFSTRLMYTNGEEFIVRACRPVLFNGINAMLARGDLADRAVKLTLAPISGTRRRTDREMQAAFQAASPGILGALFNGLAVALRDLPGLVLPSLPRMADFALLACAAAPAFGWTAEGMLKAIVDNQGGIIAGVADSDAVAVAVRDMLDATAEGKWTGTATQLLALLNGRVSLETKANQSWPKDATRLSGRLRRVAGALRAVGVEIEMVDGDDGGGRKGRLMTITDTKHEKAKPDPDATDKAKPDLTILTEYELPADIRPN
jgi:putative DNA primase/helicase